MGSVDESQGDLSRFALPEEVQALYLRIVSHGGALPEELVSPRDEEPLRRLADLKLVVHEPWDGAWVAANPQRLQSAWAVTLHAEAVRTLAAASAVSPQVDELSRLYARHIRRQANRAESVDYVQGGRAVRARIAALMQAVREEVLTVVPGQRDFRFLAHEATDRDRALARDGVRRRTIYESIVRRDPAARQYCRLAPELGIQLRTLNGPVGRMFILDRRTAIIPLRGNDPDVAAFVTEPVTVAFMISCFESDWARADPFDDFHTPIAERLTEVQRLIVTLLSEGLSQPSIAGRLGLSERTVAHHVATIRAQYGADTLFQLGLAIGREQGRQDEAAQEDLRR